MQEDEIAKQLAAIEKAICGNTGWIGTTTREVRDKIETATKEVNALSGQLSSSASALGQRIENLTKSIDRQSASNSKLTRWMVVLTAFLAIATTIMAVASVLQIKMMKCSQTGRAYVLPEAGKKPGHP